MSGVDRTLALRRLTQDEPADLDDLLGPYDPRRDPVGRDLAPCPGPSGAPPTPLARADEVVVATHVTAPLADPADVAFRLMALAAEQDVEVVVFSDLDYSGLERFGFRTERVAGATAAERDACLAELRAFWGVELTV